MASLASLAQLASLDELALLNHIPTDPARIDGVMLSPR
jgi:hypothetical protein